MSYEQIFENVKELHRINFQEVIKLDNYDENVALNDKYYDFTNCRFNDNHKVIGCCKRCEDKECNTITDVSVSEKDRKKYEKFMLENVSHGSHTIDFLNASGLTEDAILKDFQKGWKETPVLFLMENPSIDYHHMYRYCDNKYPTNAWYWIHDKKELQNYKNVDSFLKQGYYGDMVFALIKHYKLANAYLTNIIKCGMNNKNSYSNKEEAYKNESYLGTWWYKDDCKKTCITEILAKEVENLTKEYENLKVVAFGSNAYWLAKEYFQQGENKALSKKNVQLVQLPHPSSRISNNYRKYVVKGILDDLFDNENNFKVKNSNIFDGKTVNRIVEKFKEKGIDVVKMQTLQKKQKKIVIKYKTTSSIFNNKEHLKEVWLMANSGNEFMNNPVKTGYGYNFIDETFWGWNYDNDEYIPIETIKTSEIFKDIIKELLND